MYSLTIMTRNGKAVAQEVEHPIIGSVDGFLASLDAKPRINVFVMCEQMGR